MDRGVWRPQATTAGLRASVFGPRLRCQLHLRLFLLRHLDASLEARPVRHQKRRRGHVALNIRRLQQMDAFDSTDGADESARNNDLAGMNGGLQRPVFVDRESMAFHFYTAFDAAGDDQIFAGEDFSADDERRTDFGRTFHEGTSRGSRAIATIVPVSDERDRGEMRQSLGRDSCERNRSGPGITVLATYI